MQNCNAIKKEGLEELPREPNKTVTLTKYLSIYILKTNIYKMQHFSLN